MNEKDDKKVREAMDRTTQDLLDYWHRKARERALLPEIITLEDAVAYCQKNSCRVTFDWGNEEGEGQDDWDAEYHHGNRPVVTVVKDDDLSVYGCAPDLIVAVRRFIAKGE